MESFHKNFWELSPYCYCRNRDWLTIDDINTVPIPYGGEDTEDIVAVSGLSRDDTALLAAFLSALALLLFLLFLLLCCLFPWGLCCKDGNCCCGICAGSGKGRKRKEVLISSSGSSAGSVNLTALDMKIPRPWTDNLDGYSDSEFEKSRKLYAETNLDKTDHGAFTNDGYQRDSSFFQDGGWFTTSDLESVYGSTGRGSRRRRERRRSFDETGSASGTYSKSHRKNSQNNASRSMNNLDTLMTYSQNQIYGHDTEHAQQASANSRYQTVSSSNVGGGVAIGGDVTSFTRYHGDSVTGDGAGSIVEELKLTRTKTLNLPALKQSHQERTGELPSVTSAAPYTETTNQIVPFMGGDSTTSVSLAGQTSLQNSPPNNDMVSEYRAYSRRVLKETTTTTTTTTE